MSTDYTPELGQMGFSNTPWQQYDGDPYISGLDHIGEAVEAITGGNPCANAGDSYVSDIFEMRAYCWCDGDAEGHEDGCPPNFVHKSSGLTICWYKYLGRGMSANRECDRLEWLRIAHECVADTLATQATS